MAKYKLLDLFCKAGGAGTGYANAGFEVVGVDIVPQPNYPYELNAKQIVLYWGFVLGGIDWMTRAELAEAIPPAYTEFLGRQFIRYIETL